MVRRQINRSDIEKDPNLLWNLFVDLVAVEDYEELNEVQRLAHLVFWYDAEIQNGGHLQYFANSSGKRANETVAALSELGMDCQSSILNDAVVYISKNPLPDLNSVDEYISEALTDRFSSFDQRYYGCTTETMQFLEEYLEMNLNDFIELT